MKPLNSPETTHQHGALSPFFYSEQGQGPLHCRDSHAAMACFWFHNHIVIEKIFNYFVEFVQHNFVVIMKQPNVGPLSKFCGSVFFFWKHCDFPCH